MPTPDGRAWLTSAQIAQHLFAWVRATHPEIIDCLDTLPKQDGFIAALREAFVATGYTQELKIARLCEKLKVRVVDRGLADVATIRQALMDIYDADVLAGFDEEGQPIP